MLLTKLPIELRQTIYGHAITTDPNEPEYPWELNKPILANYLTLQLVCKQTFAEIMSMSSPEASITLGFNNVPALYDPFKASAAPLWQNANFRLAQGTWEFGDDSNVTRDFEQFVSSLASFNSEWSNRLFSVPSPHFARDASLAMEGFDSHRNHHTKVDRKDTPYLRFAALGKNLTLTSYAWDSELDGQGEALVLEGRLKDLVFDSGEGRLDMQRARQHVAFEKWYRGL